MIRDKKGNLRREKNSLSFKVNSFFYLLVLAQMSFVTVRTGNDFLGTVFVQMFLQKSFLKFCSTVILAQDFSVLAV